MSQTQTQKQPITCPRCNAKTFDGSSECWQCGNDLKNEGCLSLLFFGTLKGIAAFFLLLVALGFLGDFLSDDSSVGSQTAQQPIKRPSNSAPTDADIVSPSGSQPADRPAASDPDREAVNEKLATMLNLNGLLCAKVVSVAPLERANTYEVTCIAYRGGSTNKTYIFNGNTGKAFEP